MNENKMVIDERIKRIIAGAVAEIDLEQIEILKNWSPAERVRQACAMIKAGEDAAAYRLRQREPHLTSPRVLARGASTCTQE